MPDALDTVYPLIVASLAPDVPEDRVYVNERDTSATLPMCWVYLGNRAPGLRHFEANELLYVHLWARTHAKLLALEGKLAWLSGYGEIPEARFGRPNAARNQEPDAWHSQIVVPYVAYDLAMTGEATAPEVPP